MEWVTERYKLVYNAETKRAVSRWGIWTDRKREWEEEKGGGRGRLATELEGSKKKRGRRGRKRAAHNGLILTFLWGPVLPVSFQMNGNCPAGFNHVLNWEREKKDEEEKEKKKEESASTAIENRSLWESTYCYSALSPITQVRTVMQTHKHTLSFSLCNNHTLTCKPMSEPMTEALITVIARCREDKKMRGEGEIWRRWESWSVERMLPSWPQCQLWQQTERKDNRFVKGVIAITSLILHEQCLCTF